MDTLTPAIGYTRTNGGQTSLDRQQHLITQLAEETGHTITHWTDSFDEALNLVKTCAARTILAADLFRMSRDAAETLGWLRQIHNAGGRVETLDGPVDMDDVVKGAVLTLAAAADDANGQVRRKAEAVHVRRQTRAPHA